MATDTTSRFSIISSSMALWYCIVMAVIIHSTSAREFGESPSSAKAVLSYWQKMLPGTAMPAMVRNLVTPLTCTDATTIVTEVKKTGSVSFKACKTANIFCDWKHFENSVHPTSFQIGYTCVIGEETCFPKDKSSSPGGLGLTAKHSSFFRERAILKGAKITLHDQLDEVSGPAFLPRGLAELFPLRHEELPRLLQKFDIPSGSLLAAEMAHTLKTCNQSPMRGEIVSCTNSIEALADFVALNMGSKKVEVLTFPAQQQNSKGPLTVLNKVVKAAVGDKYISCHNAMFVFGVYYCHSIGNSTVFEVSLQEANGGTRKNIAVCHRDTRLWNANHFSFRELGTKPGESEACHWVGDQGLTFVQSRV